MDFEIKAEVNLTAYLKMIELKTAVLLGASLKIGAIIGGADEDDAHQLYEFGRNLGIAFQLQDDLLDAFGDPKTFGKKVGGDIVENKKTILYHLTMAHANADDKASFEQLMTSTPVDENKKITAVKTIYEATEVPRRTVEQVSAYSNKAMDALQQSTLSSDQIAYFIAFAEELMVRTK